MIKSIRRPADPQSADLQNFHQKTEHVTSCNSAAQLHSVTLAGLYLGKILKWYLVSHWKYCINTVVKTKYYSHSHFYLKFLPNCPETPDKDKLGHLWTSLIELIPKSTDSHFKLSSNYFVTQNLHYNKQDAVFSSKYSYSSFLLLQIAFCMKLIAF